MYNYYLLKTYHGEALTSIEVHCLDESGIDMFSENCPQINSNQSWIELDGVPEFGDFVKCLIDRLVFDEHCTNETIAAKMIDKAQDRLTDMIETDSVYDIDELIEVIIEENTPKYRTFEQYESIAENCVNGNWTDAAKEAIEGGFSANDLIEFEKEHQFLDEPYDVAVLVDRMNDVRRNNN